VRWNKIRRALALMRITLSRYWLPKHNPRFVQTNVNGLQLLALANEDVGRELVYGGAYEPHDTAVLKRCLRPDDICIDVGANIGYYTTLMAKLAYAGEVHAFEPVPMNWHVLNCNLQLNNLKRVFPNFAALAEKPGRISFSVSRDGAYSSIRATGREVEFEVIETEVKTLDSYVLASKLVKVDVIKADVEGAEGLVLAGSEKLFCDPVRRPRLVMLELFDPNLKVFGTGIDQILSRMAAWGYSPMVSGPDGALFPFCNSMKNRICNIFFELNFPENKS
jgi:FkbM family methyltransferase